MRWFRRECGRRVRRRILGIRGVSGRRKTDVGVREVEGVGGTDEGSMWPTYLRLIVVQEKELRQQRNEGKEMSGRKRELKREKEKRVEERKVVQGKGGFEEIRSPIALYNSN